MGFLSPFFFLAWSIRIRKSSIFFDSSQVCQPTNRGNREKGETFNFQNSERIQTAQGRVASHLTNSAQAKRGMIPTAEVASTWSSICLAAVIYFSLFLGKMLSRNLLIKIFRGCLFKVF